MIPGFNVTLPGADIADVLLPVVAAREKLFELRVRTHEANGGLMAISDEIRETRQNKQQREISIAKLSRKGNQWGLSNEAVATEQRFVSQLSEGIARLEKRYGVAQEKWQKYSQCLSRIENYLPQLISPNIKISAAVAAADPRRGEDFSATLARVRVMIEDINNKIERARAAPLPSSIKKERARVQVARYAADAQPRVFPGGELGWPYSTIEFASREPARLCDVVGLHCLFNKDAVLAVIDRQIDAAANDKEALTDAQRGEREQELMADRLKVERQEEAVIMAAGVAGIELDRRPDADPRAVLGITGPAPKE